MPRVEFTSAGNFWKRGSNEKVAQRSISCASSRTLTKDPLGVFFLAHPPREEGKLPDFRQPGPGIFHKPLACGGLRKALFDILSSPFFAPSLMGASFMVLVSLEWRHLTNVKPYRDSWSFTGVRREINRQTV
jgi:hypothetical protein